MTDTLDAFTAAAAFCKVEEGGYTADPRDSGNWSTGVVGTGSLIGSNMGVGAPAAIAWLHPNEKIVTAAWMRGIGVASIWAPLAKARYWRPLQCDAFSPGLAVMLFDYGWNRGIANSARQLQEAVGANQDGDIGPATVRLVTGIIDQVSLLHKLATIQEAHYRTLSNFSTYGKGWMSRTERRLARALSLTGR